jgi:hypothetical protein
MRFHIRETESNAASLLARLIAGTATLKRRLRCRLASGLAFALAAQLMALGLWVLASCLFTEASFATVRPIDDVSELNPLSAEAESIKHGPNRWRTEVSVGIGVRQLQVFDSSDSAPPSLSRLIRGERIGRSAQTSTASVPLALEARRHLFTDVEAGLEMVVQHLSIRQTVDQQELFGRGADLLVSAFVEPDSGLWLRPRLGARVRGFHITEGDLADRAWSTQGQLGIILGLTGFSNPSWRQSQAQERNHWSADIEIATMAIGLGDVTGGVLRDSSSLRIRARRTLGAWQGFRGAPWFEAQFFHLHRAYYGATATGLSPAVFVDDLTLALAAGFEW